MKKMLLVSYFFPPINSPEAIQVGRTAYALSKLGWAVTVLTVNEISSGYPLDYEQNKYIPTEVNVIRENLFAENFFKKNGLFLPKRKNLFNRLLFLAGFPEFELLWYPKAIRKVIDLLQQESFDMIYSRANTQVSNIVASKIKSLTKIPWVSHFSDPWVDNTYFNFNKQQMFVAKALEKKIIKGSDAVEFTTQETLDLVMKKYPANIKKAFVVPHGFDERVVSSFNLQQKKGDRLVLLYSGTLYGKRSPEGLIKAINSLKQYGITELVEVHLIGSGSNNYEELVKNMELQGTIFLENQLSFIDALEKANNADMLLLIDAPDSTNSVFLPSKLVDYMLLRKPILGITPISGAAANLLQKMDCLVVDPNDIDGIANLIMKYLVDWRNNRISVSKGYEMIRSEYNIISTTQRLSRVLDNLITGRRNV